MWSQSYQCDVHYMHYHHNHYSNNNTGFHVIKETSAIMP